MEDLTKQLNSLKKRYRYLFIATADEILKKVQDIKPNSVSGDIFDTYEKDSPGWSWQKDILNLLRAELKQSRHEKLNQIAKYRKSYACSGCGTCCRFAVSEFSPDELEQKAKNGDNYAKQFLSVFIPYNNLTEARKIFPEYLVLLEAGTEQGYYFYHCPKVTQDNRCPDYENRPQICRDFPDNPVGFLPLLCGYNSWKLQSEDICLKLNAEVEIIEFYLEKLKVLLNL